MSAFAHLEPQRRLVALFLFLSAATLLQALMPTQQAFAQCDCIVWAGSYDLCELPDGVNPLVPCSSGCDSDFDGDVDKDDLRSFIDDSAECADHGGPPPLDWLKAVIDYFIGHCGGCPGFNIDIEDIIGLIGEYYPGPIPPELIDHFNDLLPPPGEIEPPATEPSEPPEIDDPGDDDNGDGVLDVHASNDDLPNRPPVVLETYSYDRSSNPLTRLDARYGAHLGNRDFAFTYDGLDRLIESDRGNASTWGQAGTQNWTLDMLGNWATFRWDRNGDGDFTDGNETDVRAHNSANEIDDRTLEYPSPVSDVNAPVTYDDAGNVRLRYETGTTRLELTHDAWNRLVKVRRITGNIEDPPLDVSRHEYNGLHWRIMSVEDTDTPRDGELDQRRAYFYSASWQVLEEWVEVSHDPDPYEEGLISDYRMQQFWGLRHVDDAVMLRRQEETGEDAGDFTRVSFQLTDRQFSVVAVVDESGMLMERVTYDPYGRAQHRWPGDFNGDGYADSTDTGALAWYEQIGDVDYRADHDLDRSGEIDLDDLIIAVGNWSGRGPLGSGQISDPEGPANRVGYAGYRFEPSSALYHVRFRWYDTGLGRWIERDPAGYVDGHNLFEYVRSTPIMATDPSGLELKIALPREDWGATKRIEGVLKELCPNSTVENKSVTVNDHDSASCAGKTDAAGKPCKESPGCKMLRDLNKSPTEYKLGLAESSRNKFAWTYDGPNGPTRYKISITTVGTPWIYKIDDNGKRVKDRVAEPWELAWHEITHAHRHSAGLHPFKDDVFPIKEPTAEALAQEEVDTINTMNGLRSWWQHCGNGSTRKNNVTPRDPNGHS